MPRTPLQRPALAVALLACALVTSSCASGIEVPVPDPLPVGVAAYTCAALKGQLPDEVLSQTTTATKPQSSFTQAWGSPAIVLRCGVPTPAALTPTSQLLTVDGVDWLPEELSQGYLFTTIGRELNIEVSVPDAYSPESDALVDLSGAVSTAVRVAPTPAPATG